MAKPLFDSLVFFFLLVSILSSTLESRRLPQFLGRNQKTKINLVEQYSYETRYFEQILDHFSFNDLPTFQQRYLINSDHWVGPSGMGPIFLYCGNEGDIEWFAANTGFVWELAPRFGAMVIFPEHRYYGESVPYGSQKEAYKNASTLAHLTAEQALADYAVLITDLKRNLSAEASPVILFGGSYGGTRKHELFRHYKEILGYNNFCGKLKSSEDLSDWLDSAYSYLAMVDYPYPSEFLMPLPAYPIKEVCKEIDNLPDGTSVLDRIFKGISVYYNYTGEADCFQLDDDPHGMSGWNWQACTEMVMPMSSNKNSSMFPEWDYNATSYAEDCWNEFRNISESIVALVTEEGAHHLDLRAATTNDPDWLVEQRASEIKIIEGWIVDYYKKTKLVFNM
ncbi:hypothetical protein Ccrd_005543 [Cynara cardunculus var. scolymus]|uniref:Peptidase S28 n=1 Tax=Cynara cardunculus var. scolymus TaxID=59895 RepID=A0A103XKP4_CYNCS|nr:hypothetical protein Ccrd_005543 [Cynara cardunculus var. scolymus]